MPVHMIRNSEELRRLRGIVAATMTNAVTAIAVWAKTLHETRLWHRSFTKYRRGNLHAFSLLGKQSAERCAIRRFSIPIAELSCRSAV